MPETVVSNIKPPKLCTWFVHTPKMEQELSIVHMSCQAAELDRHRSNKIDWNRAVRNEAYINPPMKSALEFSTMLLGGSAGRHGQELRLHRRLNGGTDRLWSGSLNRAHWPSRAKRPGGSERNSFGDCRSMARTLLIVDFA